MSRTGRDRRLRLRLFELGNNKCPICLTGFTEADVREGETVELEHVPAKSLRADGFAMCLTCADCNTRASQAEKVVAEMAREEARGDWKARIDIPGMRPQIARASFGGRVIMFPTNAKAHYEAMSETLRKGKSYKMQVKVPTSHYASVPWLKAAYLSVFSLLGRQGYHYARGEAIEQVRRQIMEPGTKTLSRFCIEVPLQYRDGIVMNTEQRPCWAVKARDRLVLLPQSWDTSFYEECTKPFDLEGLVWAPARFGHIQVDLAPYRDFGTDPFGKVGMLSWGGDGATPVVIADYTKQHMTVVKTTGWRIEHTFG